MDFGRLHSFFQKTSEVFQTGDGASLNPLVAVELCQGNRLEMTRNYTGDRLNVHGRWRRGTNWHHTKVLALATDKLGLSLRRQITEEKIQAWRGELCPSETPRSNAQSAVDRHGVPRNWSLEEGLGDLDFLASDQQTMPNRLATCFANEVLLAHSQDLHCRIIHGAYPQGSRVEYL